MILTVTINPAIDRTLTVDRLVFDDRAYILSTEYGVGGRGINASKTIHLLGGDTRAILPAGGASGRVIEESLKQLGFSYQLVPIRRAVRTNFTISQEKGLTIKLNELGPKLAKKEWVAVQDAVFHTLPKAKWLMLCGSVPPSVPGDFYSSIIQRAKQQNVPVVLDTDNEALTEGIKAGPTVVSPNQQEAERLLGTVMITRTHFLDAVRRIHQMGAESVVLSLGSRGVMALHEGKIYESVPPRIEVVCAIGAGDALCAAFCWAMSEGKSFQEAIRWAVAAGTASAKLPGVNFASREQTEEIYRNVDVHEIVV